MANQMSQRSKIIKRTSRKITFYAGGRNREDEKYEYKSVIEKHWFFSRGIR